jgi:hypothetical protein
MYFLIICYLFQHFVIIFSTKYKYEADLEFSIKKTILIIEAVHFVALIDFSSIGFRKLVDLDPICFFFE